MNPIEPLRPRPTPTPWYAGHERIISLVATLALMCVAAFAYIGCARVATADPHEVVNENIRLLGNRSAMLTSERNVLRAELRQRDSEVERLTSEVESATAAVRAVEDDNASLLERVRAAERRTEPSRGTSTRESAPKPTGAVWTREKVEVTLLLACQHHGIPEAEHAWVISKGADIAWKESSYITDNRKGQHIGLFQFNDSWATEAERLDPEWSCYRFVQAYRDGGQANIRKHWSTY